MFKCEVLKRLDHLDVELNALFNVVLKIQGQLEFLMATAQDIKNMLAQVDAATNDVASRIQRLMDQLTGGVSATEAEEIKTQLQPLVTRLQGMGKDPANPVP